MRILYHSPYPADACSWYRGMGVLPHLPGVTVDLCPEQVSWAVLASYDILFMQRPYLEEHLALLELAQPILPVVVDYDDNLLEVPTWNPCWELYQQSNVRAVVKTFLTVADTVCLSTQELAEQWDEFTDNENNWIIPNAYNDYLLSTTPPSVPREPIIFWRGSHTHVGDLMEHQDTLIEIASTYPHWRWVFMGSVPWMLEGKMKFEYRTPVDIMQYFRVIREEIPAAIHISPLKECKFNRAKSDIAHIEGKMAGAEVAWGFHKQHFHDMLVDTINKLEHPMPSVAEVPLLSETNFRRLTMFNDVIEARK